MKIFIYWKDDEDTEIDNIIAALQEAMPRYARRPLNDRNDKNGSKLGTHHACFIHNFRHSEI